MCKSPLVAVWLVPCRELRNGKTTSIDQKITRKLKFVRNTLENTGRCDALPPIIGYIKFKDIYRYSLTMKFVAFLLLPVAPFSVCALSNVAPGTFERRIKSATSEDFDPTAGDNAALIYNNNDEVWVPQVRMYVVSVDRYLAKNDAKSLVLFTVLTFCTFC